MEAVLLALALGLADPPPSDASPRAAQLVARLGHPDYRDREKAAQELLALGYAAKDAVLAGQKSPDEEISDRCRKLYPLIWRDALDRRVEKFVADPAGPVPADLPGAADWLKVTGDTKESRRLYAELLLAYPETLLDLDQHPDRRSQLYTDLVRDVYGRTGVRPSAPRPGPTDTEALLFLFLGTGGGLRTTFAPGTSSSYYYSFLNSTAITNRLAESAPVRKLYAGWLERERYSLTLRRGIDIAAQNGVKECLPALTRIAKDPGTIMYIRATALLGFAKLGTKDDIPALEPFLKDQTVVANVVVNGDRGTVQLRDAALGAVVQVAGQNLTDFGFERKMPAGIAAVSYTYFAFGTEEKRTAAHQKWKDWAAAHLKK